MHRCGNATENTYIHRCGNATQNTYMHRCRNATQNYFPGCVLERRTITRTSQKNYFEFEHLYECVKIFKIWQRNHSVSGSNGKVSWQHLTFKILWVCPFNGTAPWEFLEFTLVISQSQRPESWDLIWKFSRLQFLVSKLQDIYFKGLIFLYIVWGCFEVLLPVPVLPII